MNSASIEKSLTKLRNLSEIPLKYRHLFSQYENFNQVQSKVFDRVLHTDESIVISAPTGSGKTAIFELAILRLLIQMEQAHEQSDFKIVYVAPVKALCMEKFTDWRQRFEPIGLECIEVTGDSDIADFNSLTTAKLVVTTPEKWDSLTRKWKEAETVLKAVKLFIIDEVHLVNEDVRGPTLEAVVSRMKTIQYAMRMKEKTEKLSLRFMAASATIPNVDDLAAWLGEETPACSFRICESLRPVPLQKHVIGFNMSAKGFRFDMNLNYKLPGVIRKYSNDKPTLIFCSSRKSVEMATKVLSEQNSLVSLSDMQKIELQRISRQIHDNKLKQLMINGIAYHHAGLSYQDRSVIEDAFRKSNILILVCTNTLAMGVNFPAHLVIVKSTENYVGGTTREYTESAVLQMIGRAGRPQFDESGVAVIMTQQKNVRKYENLMNGCTPIESHLHKHLAEHLNSEIVLQTVTDLTIAMKWIRSTFLYERAVKCPVSYGFAHGMAREAVEKKLEEMCVSQINALERYGLVVKDQTFGFSIASTNIGKLMARYYISFDTIKVFRQLHGGENFLELFNMIIRCKEFSEFTLRVNDKKTLNEINNYPIRFPIKGKIKTNQNKISCLIQAVFDNIQIQDSSMTQDAYRMVRTGEKLSKCLAEYIRLSESYFCMKIFKALSNSLALAKCFKAKLWQNTEYVSRQLKNIGPVYSAQLVNAGKTTIQSIKECDPRQIEMERKPPPFGDQIIASVSAFPRYSMKLIRKSQNLLQVNIEQTNDQYHYDGQNSVLIIGDADNNLLFHNYKIDQIICEERTFERTFLLKDDKTTFIQAKLIHENLVGVDQEEKLILNPEEDLVEPKRSKTKIQSKLKVKRTKKTLQKQQRLDRDEKPPDCLLENDEYFDNLNLEDIQNSVVKTKPMAMNHTTLECNGASTEINSPASDPATRSDFKRKLEMFDRIPQPKISKSDTAKILHSQHQPAPQTDYYGGDGNSFLDEDEVNEDMEENAIVQEIFETDLRMEEDFINSLVSKNIDDRRNSKNLLSSAGDVQPLDLSVIENLGQCAELQHTTTKPRSVVCEIHSEPAVNMITDDVATGSEAKFENTTETTVLSNHSTENELNISTQKASELDTCERLGAVGDGEKAAPSDSHNVLHVRPNNAVSSTMRKPNLSKLRSFPCFTPTLNNNNRNHEFEKRGTRSCHFKQSKLSNGNNANKINAPDVAWTSSYGCARKESKQIPTAKDEHTSIFHTPKAAKTPTPKSHEVVTIFQNMCEKFVGKENLNEKTRNFLKKLEEDLSSDKESEKTDKIYKFLEDIPQSKSPLPQKIVSEIKSAEVCVKKEFVAPKRSFLPQSKFHKTLEIKRQQPQTHPLAFPKCETKPENKRIDAMLEHVLREPIKNISIEEHNPYRMIIPKRHEMPNLMKHLPKQSFDYFENLRRKSDLEELNKSFSSCEQRSAEYRSEMSRVLFADKAKDPVQSVSSSSKSTFGVFAQNKAGDARRNMFQGTSLPRPELGKRLGMTRYASGQQNQTFINPSQVYGSSAAVKGFNCSFSECPSPSDMHRQGLKNTSIYSVLSSASSRKKTNGNTSADLELIPNYPSLKRLKLTETSIKNECSSAHDTSFDIFSGNLNNDAFFMSFNPVKKEFSQISTDFLMDLIASPVKTRDENQRSERCPQYEHDGTLSANCNPIKQEFFHSSEIFMDFPSSTTSTANDYPHLDFSSENNSPSNLFKAPQFQHFDDEMIM